MTTFLTPESPLGLAVQRMLLGEPGGLTVPEIRRRLRHSGKVAEERSLRQLLGHAQTFMARASGRYALVDLPHAEALGDDGAATNSGLSDELAATGRDRAAN